MGFLCGWCSSEVLLFFCCIFCHFVADLQQRQLIREGAVAAVSSLLEQASGKISWELLFLGTLVVCCSMSGPAFRGIWLCQFWQMAFVGYLLVVDYLCNTYMLTVVRLLRSGKWKLRTSGNRRKLHCLQRRIGVVHWREVSWIVRGDSQSQLRLSLMLCTWRRRWRLFETFIWLFFGIISRRIFQAGVL